MEEILIITDYRNLYRQGINRNCGVDVDIMRRVFEEEGYSVSIHTYDEIVNEIGIVNISNKIIFYTSSQNLEYRMYIDDIIFELGKRNTLVPRYDLLKAHENKCYEEVMVKDSQIPMLKSNVYATYRDVLKYCDDFRYPIIVKSSTGAGSLSVYKADSKQELLRIVKRISKKRDIAEYYLKYVYKRIKGKSTPEYLKDEKYFGKYIVEEFVPNLKSDWKVLAFGNRFFALNRGVRKHDFRASGSGKFDFLDPPEKILDSAKSIFEKMDVPFLSMDLCIDDDGNVHMIEFQGLHFGPYTLINSEAYYSYSDNGWEKNLTKSDLAETYSRATIEYLRKKENDK